MPTATSTQPPQPTAAPTTPTSTPESRTEVGLWVDLGAYRDAGLFDEFKKEYPNILLKIPHRGEI